MEKFDASCLIDAKKEYTQRFVRKLKVPFLNKIMELFSETKDESVNIHEEDKLLIHFQNKLESIPEYSLEKIESLTRSIILETKCDYLEELFQGVYIVHTKVLAVIQHHKSNTKSELKIPTIEDFIFQAFINISRSMWKYAYLFKESNNTCEYQKNTNSIENRIESSIKETLEDVLPVRELLIEHVKDYIDGEKFDDIDADDDTLHPKTNLLKRHKKKNLISGGFYNKDDIGNSFSTDHTPFSEGKKSFGDDDQLNTPSFGDTDQSNTPSFNDANQSNIPSLNDANQSNTPSLGGIVQSNTSFSEGNKPTASLSGADSSNIPSFGDTIQSNTPLFGDTIQSDTPPASSESKSSVPLGVHNSVDIKEIDMGGLPTVKVNTKSDKDDISNQNGSNLLTFDPPVGNLQ